MIEISDLVFCYNKNDILYNNLNYKFEKGEFYFITGASGAGKSTLLRLINRLEEPDSGAIFLEGSPVVEIPITYLRRKILYIQQVPVVQEGSVRDNLLLPFRFKSNKDLAMPEDNILIERLNQFQLNKVGLDDIALSLSTGQIQRLCIIRGLLLAPDVILLDEPTSSLDNESRLIVEREVEELCLAEKKTVIMVSHRKFNLNTVHAHELAI